MVGLLRVKAAARLVLKKVGHTLPYTGITELALVSVGYLKSCDHTPDNTMRARISVDVRDDPESRFVQRRLGVYGLKGHAS